MNLVLFVGPTGSGKSSIIGELLRQVDCFYINSLTTRDKREGESEGNPYYFTNKENFLDKINNNEFIEYESIHGNYYGLSKSIINGIINKNTIYLKDIGVEGACKLKDMYFNDVKFIFIDIDSKEEIKDRLFKRGQSFNEIEKRLERIEYERTFIDKADFYILNKDLQETVEKVKEFIIKG